MELPYDFEDFPDKEYSTQNRFKSNFNLSIIGPRIELSSHPKKQISTISQYCSESQVTSSYISQTETNSSKIARANNTFALGAVQMIMERQKKKIAQNPANLKKILTQQKIKIMVKNFVKKLSRNNINSTPIEFTPFLNEKQLTFLDIQGIQLNDGLQICFFICSILLIISLTIMSTLSLVFHQVETSVISKVFSGICLTYFTFEVILNLITVKFQQGKRLSTLKEILEYYTRKTFITDVFVIAILFIDQFTHSDLVAVTYLRIFVVFKLSQIFQKIEKLQVFFIHNFYEEQYWSLIKVFLFNFSLAHLLAIFLVLMASNDNSAETWMGYKDIYLAQWYEKYAWAYYWATTIMLTVGFGDLTATNYQEAVVLTLIEMISCIALAYNINCVGMLISNIRSQDLEKGKNFKLFYKLSRKNGLSQELEWRINNYIEESSNIKKKFNYEEENQFVNKLPIGLKTQFLKESNKKIFKNLPFFRNLMERTLLTFAQKIQIRVCHPEQIIQQLDDPHHLLILKSGEIGFTCKKSGCMYNSTVIDQLKILDLTNPILISLGFIQNPRLSYEVKSLAYSVLYFLDYQSILSILKGSQMDYELYCLMRDKASNMPDDFELFNCEICKDKHTKFSCPKLHFIPIKQHITDRYIYRVKNDKDYRRYSKRYSTKFYKPLKLYKGYFQHIVYKPKSFFHSKRSLRRAFTINELASQRRQRGVQKGGSEIYIKSISQMKDFFSKNTVEIIKNQMKKALYFGQGNDEVWIIESDKMKNYRNYFKEDNSCYLSDKFSIEKRNPTLMTSQNTFNSMLRNSGHITHSQSKLPSGSNLRMPDSSTKLGFGSSARIPDSHNRRMQEESSHRRLCEDNSKERRRRHPVFNIDKETLKSIHDNLNASDSD